MYKMKSCCCCFTLKTGTVILGCLGILFAVLSIIPPCLLLEDHGYYINEYIKKSRANQEDDIRDEEIPYLISFDRKIWASIIAYNVIFTLVSMLLITGVAAEKKVLLIPWMVVVVFSILIYINFGTALFFAMLAFAIGKDYLYTLVIVFPLIPSVYFWMTVYSTYHQMRAEEEAGLHQDDHHPVETTNSCRVTQNDDNGTQNTTQRVPQSLSNSSFTNVKDSIQRVMGGTPPPPYEAVALDIDKEEEAIAAGVDLRELTFTSVADCRPPGASSSAPVASTSSSQIVTVDICSSSSDQSPLSSPETPGTNNHHLGGSQRLLPQSEGDDEASTSAAPISLASTPTATNQEDNNNCEVAC